MTNHEILNEVLKSGLLKKCVDHQFYKAGMTDYKEDFFQDLCLIILEYDNAKLNNAYQRHMNAWITRVIQNNIKSVNSPFYRDYKKWDNLKTEITDDFNDIVDE